MTGLNSTPLSSRFTIGLFGRRNVGKSSLINAITGQNTSLISKTPGTTTDPVYKTMELLPIGPILFIDTAGFDDHGELGMLRVEKTLEVLRKCHLAMVVTDEKGFTPPDVDFIHQLKKRNIPYILVQNKCDSTKTAIEGAISASAVNNTGIDKLKQQIIHISQHIQHEPSLIEGLINADDTAILVTPIDKSAPKGRLILPQQQTVRDILDKGAMAFATKESQLRQTLESLKNPPAIVITDSQVFKQVAAIVPNDIPLTSFSILFARQKSDIAEMAKGIRRIETLSAGDRVLIAEGCTHHKQEDDIATVKIPRWIRQIAGNGIILEWTSGVNYPENLEQYDVIIHCGGCMLNSREMQHRIGVAREHGVSITNYGMLIAYAAGILQRALAPFPQALSVLTKN